MTSPMSCFFHPLKPVPCLSPSNCRHDVALSINCTHKLLCCSKPKQPSLNNRAISLKHGVNEFGNKFSWVMQMGLLTITTQVAEPALAVTGVNNEEDLILVLIKAAIVAFGYFLIMPVSINKFLILPIIMNWLRLRWYKRNLPEMYVQFMCVFLFFPGVLLWAPFINFRKFPRDPTMKYPWSKPENPSEVPGGFLKFPWATIEDYEL